MTVGALVLLLAPPWLGAADLPPVNWIQALSAMPVSTGAPPARSNVVRVTLQSFRSNAVVRALVVAPAVIDDIHLINRDAPALRLRTDHLAGLLMSVTNQTATRLVLTNSVLLWCAATDRLEPEMKLDSGNALPATLTQRCSLPQIVWIDTHWQNVQPALKKSLRLSVRPEAKAESAWHFERVNLAAHGLNDWELLRSVALSTGTRLVLRKRTVTLERP